MLEDILFIMQKENKCLPYLILEDGQYIFIGDYKDPVRHDDFREISDNSYQIILSIESILDKNYVVNSEGIIEYRKPYCSKCYSREVIKKDYNWKTLYLEINLPVRVKVRRYFCHKCGKKSQTEFSEFYKKYSNFSNKFKNKIKHTRQRTWISLRGIKDFIKDLFDIDISHETIRKELLVEGEFNYFNDEVKLSGYYAYDEQWERIEGKWVYYLIIFDIVNNVPVASMLTKKLNTNIIKNFIKTNIPDKDRIAIITDLKPEYDDIMKELNFVHQHCTFHLEKNIKAKMKEEIRKDMLNYRFKLKNNHPEYSDNELDEIIKEAKKEIKDEIWAYIKDFMKLFKQPTLNKAIKYINQLKKEMKYYPAHLSNYLNKNFFPEYRKYLRFLEEDYKDHLEPTNNKLENYNGNTMPRNEKKDL